MIIRRIPAVVGTAFALWLFLPQTAQAATDPCDPVQYQTGSQGSSSSGECEGASQIGTFAADAAALAATAAAAAAGVLGGRVPSPGERSANPRAGLPGVTGSAGPMSQRAGIPGQNPTVGPMPSRAGLD
ncbi:hypothetical protein, partial [Amycolatopsis rhizosphaerae]|uniref:hypothetical protein n=1 Tax=Amycolatopsis rhizosphaerae TaxID=2053003 RepID=UPI001C9825E2